MIVVIVVLAIILLYLFLIKGRTGHRGLPALRRWYYAHRGLHGGGVPEDSTAAFRAAKARGYGIELDIHLMKDGNLAVIHDSSLKRTAGASVRIEELTTEDLDNYHLEGTNERIPLFSDVLALFNGEAPLIVELKTVKGNYAQLCEAACKLLDQYQGRFSIESFDPRCCKWLRKHRKHIIRGHLTMNYLRTRSKLPWPAKFILTNLLVNVFTRPDFIACRFEDRKILSNVLCEKFWGVQSVVWTLRTKENFETAIREDRIPIFENFEP